MITSIQFDIYFTVNTSYFYEGFRICCSILLICYFSLAEMNAISVKFSYPTFPPTPTCSPQCRLTPVTPAPTPITRTQSFFDGQESKQKGIVGFYDIYELNEELRLFRLPSETQMALLRKRKTDTRAALGTTSSSKTSGLTSRSQKTNRNASLKQLQKWHHSLAGTNCYVDFSGSFHDKVRAHSFKMEPRNATPKVNLNFGQRMIPKTAQSSEHKQAKRRKKRLSASGAIHMKEGLLVIANGQVVDFHHDVKLSKRLPEGERKKLRERLDIVRSFDDLVDKCDATKTQVEQTSTL